MTNDLKTLTITVEGPAHTGKSTVMTLIAKALQDAGYESVEIKTQSSEPDKNYQPLTPEVARTRVDAVFITEKQTKEEPKDEYNGLICPGDMFGIFGSN